MSTAGCESCEPVVRLVAELECLSCEVAVHDLRDVGANRAIEYGIVLPVVVVNGELLCWGNAGPSPALLATAGIGTPVQ